MWKENKTSEGEFLEKGIFSVSSLNILKPTFAIKACIAK